LYVALREVSKTPRDRGIVESRRRAIVVLSDGDDTSSLIGFEEVLDLAARGDTVIYPIGLGVRPSPQPRSSPNAEFVLKRFAEQTGGRAFFPQAARDLAAVYGEIIAELGSQYSLAYESSNARRDGQFRRVAVRVERTGVVARTRPGYFAPEK
jgi:Ca-activated chloride channel homolog